MTEIQIYCVMILCLTDIASELCVEWHITFR